MKTLRTMAALAVSLLLLFGSAAPAHAALTYFHAGAHQTFTGTLPIGISANITADDVTLTAGDFHTLVQLGAQSADTTQAVEVGFTVDPTVNGDSLPRIFVSSWRSGVHRGYNAANPAWVDLAANVTYNAGTALTADTAYRMLIQYDAADCGAAPNGWWVAVYPTGGTPLYLGCFKDTDWTGQGITFVNSPFLQAFGEVAANVASPCTNMASNPPILATGSAGKQIGSISAVGLPSASVNMANYTVTNSAWYNAVADSLATPGNVRTIRVGGPGSC